MEQMGCTGIIQQAYDKITKKEEVTRIAQVTTNILCDFMRQSIVESCDNYTVDTNTVNFIASTNINTFLLRENKNVYIFH
jgi:hypothetical protein